MHMKIVVNMGLKLSAAELMEPRMTRKTLMQRLEKNFMEFRIDCRIRSQTIFYPRNPCNPWFQILFHFQSE